MFFQGALKARGRLRKVGLGGAIVLLAAVTLVSSRGEVGTTTASFSGSHTVAANLFSTSTDFSGAHVGLMTGVVPNVTNTSWTTVEVGPTYGSMVVVATANYDDASPSLVTRIRNAVGSRFEVRVDRTDGLADPVSGVSVNYVAAQEGVYSLATDGVTLEAVKVTSTVTDNAASWVGESRTYSNSYTNPVVVGQVMSYNDAAFSAFWARGPDALTPPSATELFVGKHVGEDPVTARANETIGYIVIEGGSGSVGDVSYSAAVGANTVRGMGNAPPFTYTLGGVSGASSAVVSAAGMKDSEGGWPMLYGATPLTPTALELAFEEDQAGDAERRHLKEQVAYVAFGTNTPPVVDAGTDDSIFLPPGFTALNATVTDDGLPSPPGSVTTTWSLLSGPAAVSFGDATAVDTTVSFTLTGVYELQLSADDGESVSSDTVLITVGAPGLGPQLARGVVANVDNTGWATVVLPQTYDSMVVIASANYDETSPPLVTRIQNASGNSFDVRVDRADGSAVAVGGVDVHYTVAREGVFTIAEHGVSMEAVKVTSTVTDAKGSWVGESMTYTNTYVAPVVLGQVMSYNDTAFSVFWAHGTNEKSPPSATDLFVGKHVGEDAVTTRANETIGYLVIEAGAGTASGTGYVAGVGASSIRGMGDSPPYTYALSGLATVTSATVSAAGFNNNDGGWPVLYGVSPVTLAGVNLALDEDQIGDAERRHQAEQVAYIVFE